MEVMNDMVVKLAAAYQIQLGCWYNVCSDEQGVFLCQYCANRNEGVFDDWDHSYLHPDDLLEFLRTNSLTSNVMLYTEYNFPNFKCYGHPTKPQQDWVEILIQNMIYYAQSLLFVVFWKSQNKQSGHSFKKCGKLNNMPQFILCNIISFETI